MEPALSSGLVMLSGMSSRPWLLGMLAGPLAVASGLRRRWVRWWG